MLPDYLSDISLDLPAGSHDLMPTFAAFYLDVHSYPQHLELFAAARMRFFHFQNVAHLNIHVYLSSLSQLCKDN